MNQAALFWFYKNPDAVLSRVELLRRQNPNLPLFGLYGGPRSDLDAFAPATCLMDDLWVHEEKPPDWHWRNGDLAIANWFTARGRALRWSQIFVHQWDVLTTRPLTDFALNSAQDIFISGARPLEEVRSRWIWVQPWSHFKNEYDAFCRHPLVRGRPHYASIFVVGSFWRHFLERYAEIVAPIPGFVEYRLPTLAKILGYDFIDADVHPDWDFGGDPLLNGSGRLVATGQIQWRLGRSGSGIWHPVPQPITQNELVPEPKVLTKKRAAIMQAPPARPLSDAGGSQVVARALAAVLRRNGYQVTIYCATEDTKTHAWESDGIEYCAAFALTDDLLRNGKPAVRYLDAAQSTIEQSDLIFMFDRAFPIASDAPTVLFLGAVAYAFAHECIDARDWRYVVAPSDHVARQLRAWSHAEERGDRVVVVPNPVAITPWIAPTPSNKPPLDYTLLFAHRADRIKGMSRCLRLLASLNASTNTRLLMVVDQSPTADPQYYEDVLTEANEHGVRAFLDFVPWRTRSQMNTLYRGADITLCLGDIQEGFGLIAMESIAAGTPVLMSANHVSPEVLPDDHGGFRAEEEDFCRLALQILRSPSTHEAVSRGRRLIEQRYSPSAFERRILTLVDTMA